MARFHIQLRTETHVRETLTLERENYLSLRVEVARFVGELLRDHALEIWMDEHWSVAVTDEQGLILYAMNIAAIESAATMSRPISGM